MSIRHRLWGDVPFVSILLFPNRHNHQNTGKHQGSPYKNQIPPIVEYKNKKRMELAANMLKSSDKKIIDIAYELHYDALNCFLRAFKKEYGMTPTEHRKKYKND